MSIKVGDKVTWHRIPNCTVLKLGSTSDGKASARIRLPDQHEAGALICELGT